MGEIAVRVIGPNEARSQSDDERGSQSEDERGADDSSTVSSEKSNSPGNRLTGLTFAAAVGIFGGSVLVPFKFIPEEKAGLTAVPSFGVGALLGTVVALFHARGCCRLETK